MDKGTVHRGAFCHFPFRWIYYYGSNKSTRKETGKKHLCVLCNIGCGKYCIFSLLDTFLMMEIFGSNNFTYHFHVSHVISLIQTTFIWILQLWTGPMRIVSMIAITGHPWRLLMSLNSRSRLLNHHAVTSVNGGQTVTSVSVDQTVTSVSVG